MSIEERIDRLYDLYNGWNDDGFFDNFGRFIISVVEGTADPVEVAFVKAGELWEMFHGWTFFLPKKRDVLAALDENGPAVIRVSEWVEDDTDRSTIDWTISDKGFPDVIDRFIREIVK